jgi:Zn-dependent protease with chaperone function
LLLINSLIKLLNELIYELPKSRLMENEADQVGLKLAANACYDIREAPITVIQVAKTRLEIGFDI